MNSIISVLLVFTATFLFGQNIPKSAYVANTIGNTLSVVDLENHSVIQDTLSPGPNSIPNQVILKNNRGYLVNSGTSDISVFDLATLQKIKRIFLPNDSNPWAMEFINDSLAAVSLWLFDEIAIVNVNSDQIISTIPVGVSPQAVKYWNGSIYVANSGFTGVGLPYEPGEVNVIDASALSLTGNIPVATNPQELDVDSQGNILVACTGDYVSESGKLEIINTALDTVENSVSFSNYITSVRVSSQDKAYLADAFGGGMLVYDLPSQTLELDLNNALPGAYAVAFDASDRAYILDPVDWASTGILRVFSSSHQQLNSYPVNVGPVSVAVYDPAFTDVETSSNILPAEFELYQNWPNPFNPRTTINYSLQQPGFVTLQVFNLQGQLVKTLVDERLPAGPHIVHWNGDWSDGSSAASGIYFYRIKTSSGIAAKKMHLVH